MAMTKVESEVVPLAPFSGALNIARDMLLQVWNGRQNGLDPLNALLFLTIIQINADPASAAWEAHLDFSDINSPIPDELRQPASLNGLSQSLSIPFETVRRRLKYLASIGMVQKRRGGVVVPEFYFHTETNRAVVFEMNRIASQGYRRLDGIGFFRERPLPEENLRFNSPPYRLVARLLSDYCLRMAIILRAFHGDYLDVLIFLQMTSFRSAQCYTVKSGPRASFTTASSSDHQMPAPSVQAIAKASAIPFETTRRRLKQLEAKGYCRVSADGYFEPTEHLKTHIPRLAAQNSMNLWRLYRQCALGGAIHHWNESNS